MPKYQKEVEQIIGRCIRHAATNTWIKLVASQDQEGLSIKDIYCRHILDYGLRQLQQDSSFTDNLASDENDKIILLQQAIFPTQSIPSKDFLNSSEIEPFDPNTMTLWDYIRKILTSCRRGIGIFDLGKTNGLLYEVLVGILQHLTQIDYLEVQRTFFQQSCQASSPINMVKLCDTTRNVIRTKGVLDQVVTVSGEDFVSFINNS